MENNVYIIAKKFHGRGCLAYRCKSADEALRLSEKLSELQAEGLQLVVLNSPEIYSEYAPYTYVEELEEFLARVARMGRAVPNTSTIATHGYFANGGSVPGNKSPRAGA